MVLRRNANGILRIFFVITNATLRQIEQLFQMDITCWYKWHTISISHLDSVQMYACMNVDQINVSINGVLMCMGLMKTQLRLKKVEEKYFRII